jgi:hypothetical protein
MLCQCSSPHKVYMRFLRLLKRSRASFVDHWVDGKVYWWFTESEFKEASEQLFSSRDLFPLDNGVFIYEMTNNNEPIEITLEDA